MNTRADPQTGVLTDEWMTNTNERIHRCVRVRLELEGLDLDDRGLYKATALQRKGMWRLARTRTKIDDPIPWNASWGPGAPAPAVSISLVSLVSYLTVDRVHQKSVAGCGSTTVPMTRLHRSES